MSKAVEVVRGYARAALPRPLFERISRTVDAAAGIRRLGFDGYRQFTRAPDQPGSELVRVDIPSLLHPFWVRRNRTDVQSVIGTIFREDLGKFLPGGEIRCIIDAGGYIGDSAAWCLSRFAYARVASIEPDTDNFAVLQHNLAPYSARAVSLRAGLWHRAAYLRVRPAAEPNAIEVEEVSGDEPFDCAAVTVLQVLSMLGEETIDIMKCNIEGAERALFADNCDEWLSRTRCIIIQIHDAAAMDVVRRAVAPHHFAWQRHRYLHVLHR